MKGTLPRIRQITEPRDGYLYSTYLQALNDSSSSSDDTLSEESRWVAIPLAPRYETLEVHGTEKIEKEKTKKKHKKHKKPLSKSMPSEKSYVPQTFCLFVNEEDRYSLIPPSPALLPLKFYVKDKRDSSLSKESSNSEQFERTSAKSKHPTFLIPLKLATSDSESDSLSRIFPIQRKMRATHSTGSFSGSKSRISIREISTDRKASIMKTKNQSGSMRSSSMNATQSRKRYNEYNAAYDARLKEIQITGPSSGTSGKRSSRHEKKKRKSCYGFAIVKGYYD